MHTLLKTAQESTPNDKLIDQLSYLELNEKDTIIAKQIIGTIDEDGYLRRDIESIVDDIAFSENFESCWMYENTGQNNSPDFNFVQTNFLQNDMIDLGTSSFPIFYDYNNGIEMYFTPKD